MKPVERFAPSPTGPLHLGHAYSALLAWKYAAENNGDFLLRIEDIDQSRTRKHWETQIFEDLHWLGINWPEPPLRQSDRMQAYRAALEQLWAMDLLYVCTCSRRDISEAASAPQEGAAMPGPDGIVYPGTCSRKIDHRPLKIKEMPKDATLRLDMQVAASLAKVCDRTTENSGKSSLSFQEIGENHPGHYQIDPQDLIAGVGDIVVARRGMGTSYHLAVVLDDAHQKVTHVTRGEDLFDATKIHILLQKLLDLPTPIYRHHRLVRDAKGKRLAKRDDAMSIATYRAAGSTPADIRRMVGL